MFYYTDELPLACPIHNTANTFYKYSPGISYFVHFIDENSVNVIVLRCGSMANTS